jgi:hypothetical protein
VRGAGATTGEIESNRRVCGVHHMEGVLSSGRVDRAVLAVVLGVCGGGWRGGPGAAGFRDGGQPHMRGLGTPRPSFVARPAV